MSDAIFHFLKITVIIMITSVFMVAIHTFLNLITSIFFGSVISETLAFISMYLPFNAAAVFGAISTATVAILSFMIARKIFDLTSWSISSI